MVFHKVFDSLEKFKIQQKSKENERESQALYEQHKEFMDMLKDE